MKAECLYNLKWYSRLVLGNIKSFGYYWTTLLYGIVGAFPKGKETSFPTYR